MRVLLIDRDERFRQEVTGIFTATWPAARVEHYDPEVSGRPGPGFALDEFDLVLLDNRLGREDGLDWLRAFTARPGCPPTVMLAGQGNENVAVRAMKLGAYDYLPKELLTKESLEQIVTQALGAKGARAQDAPAPATSPDIPQIEGYRLVREVCAGAVSRVDLMHHEAAGEPAIAKLLY